MQDPDPEQAADPMELDFLVTKEHQTVTFLTALLPGIITEKVNEKYYINIESTF